MKQLQKFVSVLLALLVLLPAGAMPASAAEAPFELLSSQESTSLGGTVNYYRHRATGAELVYVQNGAARLEFAIGFKTPPTDSKGANHVLEHALFCGSEKYPTKNLMHYIQNGTSSLMLNGITADDCTYYLISTENQTEYFNILDVYLNGVFHPLFLTDENIFRQQGIRVEYAGGEARYNGVVYNELRIKNLNTEENSVNFLADKLYQALYGDTAPAFSAGGSLDAIKTLSYADLLRVYQTYYIPSNSMTYLAGDLDLDRAFAALDAFFSENRKAAPAIAFPDTRRLPAKPVEEYNVDGNTQTVDIGFMSSGVPAAAPAREKYARDILYNLIWKRLGEKLPEAALYTSGGNSGGVFNLALLASEIPLARKDETIAAYDQVLAELAANPIGAAEIEGYIETQRDYFYANWENVFNGLMYQHDPAAFTEIDQVCDDLKSHKEYFVEVLKKYFTETPYRAVIVSGNGAFAPEDSRVPVSPGELERLKRETEAFQAWNDAPDKPAVIDKIPFLTLDQVGAAPARAAAVYEERDGLSYWFTEKEEGTASLYFPLDIQDGELYDTQLLYYFLSRQAEAAGLPLYAMLSPMEQATDPQKLKPQFGLGLYGSDIAGTLEKVMAFLRADDTWDPAALAAYLQSAPGEILGSYYDPYLVSYQLKSSALSAGGRFSYQVPQTTYIQGSAPYYDFLQSLDPADAPALVQRLRALAGRLLLDSRPLIEYVGTRSDYAALQAVAGKLFAGTTQRESAALTLPAGYCSAATITKLADANHFMLTAAYEPQAYSGKLAVLGKVLAAKYLTPVMRGKHGAYGTGLSFYETGMTAAVTGLADIDLAFSVWQGMGDWLRTMQLTQKELDAFIVSAVEEYDEWDYTASEYGASFALQGKTAADCDRVRREMLSTTVADIRGYADFVDELVAQQRVFAVLGKTAADSAKFDFAYYADADTLSVTPRFGKQAVYRPDETANQNAALTRGEAAVMIDRLLADRRPPEGETAFSDVKQGKDYDKAVCSLAEKGIMRGYGDGSFRPDAAITRAEFAALLSQFIFGARPAQAAAYSDVPATAWYYTAVARMTAAGYLKGDGAGSFRPDAAITRAEAGMILARMLG